MTKWKTASANKSNVLKKEYRDCKNSVQEPEVLLKITKITNIRNWQHFIYIKISEIPFGKSGILSKLTFPFKWRIVFVEEYD